MAKKYKVWVSIEEIDEEKDHYEDTAYVDCGEFDTLEEAQEHTKALTGQKAW